MTPKPVLYIILPLLLLGPLFSNATDTARLKLTITNHFKKPPPCRPATGSNRSDPAKPYALMNG